MYLETSICPPPPPTILLGANDVIFVVVFRVLCNIVDFRVQCRGRILWTVADKFVYLKLDVNVI